MIQNADDNTYGTGIAPLLDFTLTNDGYLWINCSENRFTIENVESIPSISDSTKSKSDKRRGCIGEKGIGSKSVFKIADEVRISSGKHTFKFDSGSKWAQLCQLGPIYRVDHRHSTQRFSASGLGLKPRATGLQVSCNIGNLSLDDSSSAQGN